MRQAVLAVTFALALLPSAVAAKAKPADITAQIKQSGAVATVAALRGKHKWDQVLARIGTGKPAWLAVAPLLAPGTDASTSLGLTIALADALARNPVGVLEIVREAAGPLALGQVCAAPYIKPKESDLADYLRSARHAVADVTTPGLRSARNTCLTALRSRGSIRPT